MPQESCKCIDREFVDLVMYAVYRAANELLGERTWDLVWRSGEILYERLEKLLKLELAEDPVEVLTKVAEWLQREGYVDRACVKEGPDGEIEYIMSRPAIARGAEELVREGAVPPHLSTSLMFAVLKKRGLKAELSGHPQFLPDGTVVEKWKISRAASSR
ncbi:MAG: hypothetical protein QXH94_03665 [Sulfolobales archaeon]